jgi:hypothetical protein
MQNCKDHKFWKKLNKKEIIHLLIDGGIENLADLNRTFTGQEVSRVRGFEPCWECKQIARKLRMTED